MDPGSSLPKWARWPWAAVIAICGLLALVGLASFFMYLLRGVWA